MELFEETSDATSHPYVRRLGEGAYAAEGTTVGQADLLAHVGLPVPEGMVITREAHRAFLQSSGLLGEMLAYTDQDTPEQILEPRLWHTRIGHALGDRSPSLVEGELNRAICEALMELGAPSVAVISEEVRKGDLKSIPEVKYAIREAWFSERGLERQISVARVTQEIPTWPVLIQREIYPLYTGWSTTGSATFQKVSAGQASGEKKVALYAVEPTDGERNERQSITHLTLEAASVLGTNAKIWWGLEGGRWYVVSTEMADDEKSVKGRLS
jgi:hypothetical protein